MNPSIFGKSKKWSDQLLLGLIILASLFSMSLLVICIGTIFIQGIPHFSFSYLFNTPSVLKKTVGLLPNIINTLYLIIVTLMIVCPISIGGAIYLNEYATNKKFVKVIMFTIEILAGIPSIVYGLFGKLFFGEVLGLGYSILTGSLTLSLMILPILSRNTQLALQNVPKSYREAALGMGATKWIMIRTVLLPSAIPGILTGVLLAMGRIVAESAALLFTAGSLNVLPKSLFKHLFSSGGTLTIQLYLEMTNANYDTAFVIAFLLVLIVAGLNQCAKMISRKFENRMG